MEASSYCAQQKGTMHISCQETLLGNLDLVPVSQTAHHAHAAVLACALVIHFLDSLCDINNMSAICASAYNAAEARVHAQDSWCLLHALHAAAV